MHIHKFRLFSLRLLIILVIFITGFTTKAQDPFYYRIDRSKGLPSNTVYDVFQDSKGFVWFSGSFGLCRYDGNQFLTFEANHTSSKSGTGIVEDKTGRIWYCNFDGKILYVENGKLSQLKQNSGLGFLHFAIIGNYLYAIENNGVAVYDISTLTKKHVVPFDTKKIYCTHGTNKYFYILTDSLYIMSSPFDMRRVALPAQLPKEMSGVMMQGSENELFILSKYNKFAVHYNEDTFKINEISSPDFIQNISKGHDGYWLSTTNGIFQYKKNTDVLIPDFYLSGNNVSDVLQDKSGHLWVSTLDKGVRFVPDLNTKFFYTNYSPTVLQTFKNNEILIGSDQENLYSTTLSHFSPSVLFKGKSNHSFYNLYIDTTENRIFGTSNTFKMFDLKGQLIAEVPLAVKDFVKIQDDVYAYSATWQCGLLKLSNAKTDWDSVFTTSNDILKNGLFFKPLISNVRGKSVAYAEKWKSIYFSSNKGLFKVTKQNQTEIKLHGESLNVSKLVFYRDYLLALTGDAQLYKISQHNSIQQVDIQSVLKGQLPLGIKMLNKELYVFTKNSLFRYDVIKGFAEKIISINEDFEWHDLTVSGNKLVISTNKGYIITSPVPDIKFSKPVFVIDSIRAGSELHIGTNIESVEAENSSLHIYFSNLCYSPDNQNFVQYKINNGGWVKITDNRNVIDVESLKPGNYSIKFMYGNGFVNSETTELSFVVNKPYWQKWWFILFVIIVLGFLIYRFDKWRTASINRKSQEIINRIELEKSANQSKLKALKSQMNPHFFFNALNTIQSFVLENDKKMAVNFLGKFSTLTRSILEMSDKDEVSVADEIKVLQLYLDIEMVRFNDDFEYKITTNDFDTELFKIPSLLLQPYIENAIKHGLLHKEGLKRLLISFTLEATELRIVIDDNGIGRKRSMELNAIKNKKHYSFATQAIEKRVKLLNELAGRKITVEYLDETLEDGRVQGTTVIIKIPRQ